MDLELVDRIMQNNNIKQESQVFTSSPVFIKHVREIASSPHVFYRGN